MSIERRKHERFPLALKAVRITEDNREVDFEIIELSVGGCFAKWFEEAVPGYTFQVKFPLLHGGFMPLSCKIRYRYMNVGIGVQFMNVTFVEQDSIAEIIMNHLWSEGVTEIDPFAPPKSTAQPRRLDD